MDDQAVWRRGAPVRFPSARWELTFSRALRRENGGRLELALPLPELFCFARVEEIGGEPHIIYAFDRRKAPIF